MELKIYHLVVVFVILQSTADVFDILRFIIRERVLKSQVQWLLREKTSNCLCEVNSLGTRTSDYTQRNKSRQQFWNPPRIS